MWKYSVVSSDGADVAIVSLDGLVLFEYVCFLPICFTGVLGSVSELSGLGVVWCYGAR